MAAGDKWLNEEDVAVKKPKAPKKSRKPKKPKVTQASGSPRKVTIVLSGAPDENIVLKRPASQDQSEVVVKKVTPEKTIVLTEESGQQRKSRKLSLRPVCYMKNCSVLVSHFRRHVIGKHLPLSFAVWKEMSPQRRMGSISSFLNSVEDVVGVQSHDELLELVVRNKWFPTRIGVKKFEEDDKLVCEFHHWCTGKELKEHPTISPPNCVGSLVHWRLISTVLSHVGEEKVPQVDLVPSPKEVEVSESNSKAIEPGVDVVENFVDNTAAVDTRPATFHTEEQVEELLGTATQELMETADSSILDEPKMVEERPSDVGRPYTYDIWKTRRDALFNSKSSERLLFVDSHMHLDKLQNASKRQDLCEIMKHGPMPSELVMNSLERTILNSWPLEKRCLPSCFMPYWGIRDEMSVTDGVVYRGTQAIIPSSMQKEKNPFSTSRGSKLHSVVQEYHVLAWKTGRYEDTYSSCAKCAIFSRVNTCESMLSQAVPEYP